MKRAFTLVQVLVLLAVLALLAMLLFPLFARVREDGGIHRPICQTNLKQIGLGIMQYARDYNERFPPVRASSSVGWANSIYPYVKDESLFQCDKAPSGVNNTFSTDYFYNRYLSSVAMNTLKEPSHTLVLGDGDDNAPTWNSWTQLPFDALTNSDSPSQRHLEGAMYEFADGHVKWIKPDRISNVSSKSASGTFALR